MGSVHQEAVVKPKTAKAMYRLVVLRQPTVRVVLVENSATATPRPASFVLMVMSQMRRQQVAKDAVEAKCPLQARLVAFVFNVYRSTQTGSSCTLCGLGYFWNATLRNCPKLCPIGHACHNKSLANGEAYCDQCNPCEPGSFSSFSGSYSCTLCAPGAYQSEAGQDHCQQCESGTYQTERGQKVCDVCPAGFYCPDGHTIKPCPEGKYCPQRSTVPKTCPSMFRATSKSCEFTQRLIAIIVCSCLAGVAVVAMIVYRRYKTYSRHRHDESARLIEKNQIKRPVYSGL
ncbi:uncharacterized protein MONBRDRAFT_31259 [Monosiga brevicollis MX1]|uniref:Tyrosine-protein kinase ephrin type A/B receptor-like domain-containing protein n=1 Tax=Monosiga brevicollis TaxID=81824 RepID=A9USP6_MONBE|nr:uncharacterized protein MONBRDRAFT_31259 [Monosiga brevicollis MX1]EDQ92139.1 predicted protein [Monosiga brevicollis MX1]|eukprot:XP_001743425.1 hypothetical protein [Monosiga brevicollis MX1]